MEGGGGASTGPPAAFLMGSLCQSLSYKERDSVQVAIRSLNKYFISHDGSENLKL